MAAGMTPAASPARIAVALNVVPLQSCALTGQVLGAEELGSKLSTPGTVSGCISSRGFTRSTDMRCFVYVLLKQPGLPDALRGVTGKILALHRGSVELNGLARLADDRLPRNGLLRVTAGIEMFSDVRDSHYHCADGMLVSWSSTRRYGGLIHDPHERLSLQCKRFVPVRGST